MTTSDNDTPKKQCSKCKGWFLPTTEHFMLHKGKLYSQCHNCRRAAKRDSHVRNREHNLERSRRWYEENREYAKQKIAEWYRSNREKVLAYTAEWQRLNPDKVKARNLRWVKNHPEQFRLMKKRHRQRPDVKAKRRAYKIATVAHNREWERQRYANNPEVRAKQKAKAHRRRMVEGEITASMLHEAYDSQEGRCFYCGITLYFDWHLDHMQPISRGGTNEQSNLACACPFCNLSKGSKTIAEWESVRGW